jgi:hypothetical protein
MQEVPQMHYVIEDEFAGPGNGGGKITQASIRRSRSAICASRDASLDSITGECPASAIADFGAATCFSIWLRNYCLVSHRRA